MLVRGYSGVSGRGFSLRNFAHRPCRGTNNQFWPKKNGALHLTARELLVFLLCGIALATSVM